jgi:CheY-like chemotaxis protein
MNEPRRKIRLLIAEDVDDNYLLITTLLKNDNYTFFRANDGKEAVEMVKSNQYDLVFMDLKMPVYSGLEATTIIRSFNNEIPIIAVTAFDYGHIKDEALEAGCNDFIYKPYNLQELKVTIHKYTNPQLL